MTIQKHLSYHPKENSVNSLKVKFVHAERQRKLAYHGLKYGNNSCTTEKDIGMLK